IADVALLRVMDGEFGYWDNNTGKVMGKQRLFCEMTLKSGAVAWDWNGRMGSGQGLIRSCRRRARSEAVRGPVSRTLRVCGGPASRAAGYGRPCARSE